MKKIVIALICVLMSVGAKSQNIIGAWEGYSESEKGEQIRSVVIFADGYQVMTSFEAETGKFIATNGGSWRLAGDTMTEKIEFDTTNPERVGTEISFKVIITDAEMEIVGSDIKLKRIDNGTPGKLQGAWLMSGRIRDGKTQMRDTSGPRKTMKVLSGTRFQWIAYNTETKQFMGTGGGTYTTINGKYTENIEFFSRDDSKAGISLSFDYTLKDETWNHKGFSSKGDAMHEIWSIRN
ncbi:membrane or secreted protein [Polaribacter gochangensis]|uniref:membrane or secreted protein n=1 Tax=Polaribacter gochangensis TaxID=3252903 RepID=UPI00390483A2